MNPPMTAIVIATNTTRLYLTEKTPGFMTSRLQARYPGRGPFGPRGVGSRRPRQCGHQVAVLLRFRFGRRLHLRLSPVEDSPSELAQQPKRPGPGYPLVS